MSDELISRNAALALVVKAIHETDNKEIQDYLFGELRKKLWALPSEQPDIKQAAKLLLDFVENCPGGESYLVTPDGEDLLTDCGYVADGLRLIHDWAERSTNTK